MSSRLLTLYMLSILIFAGCASEEVAMNSSDESECQSWEVIACVCFDGSPGVSSCLADGTGFGLCSGCPESAWEGSDVNIGGETNPNDTTQPPGTASEETNDQKPTDSNSNIPTENGSEEPVDPSEQGYIPDDVNWVEDVKAITDAKCVGCHSAAANLGDISLAEYDDTQMLSPNCGDATVGEAMVLKIKEPVTCGQIMPPAGYPELSTAEIKVIEDWVLLGMPYGPTETDNNADSDPTTPTDPEEANAAGGTDEMAEGSESGETTDTDTTDQEEGTGADGPDSQAEEASEEQDAGGMELEETEELVTFEEVHPILQKSCSGLACHQYSGFAQSDVNLAYQVVVEKDFANNIVDAIFDGRMPANNFGFPLCSGDPSVDTNPKCLTAEEQDLVLAWYDGYSGTISNGNSDSAEGEGPVVLGWPDAQATFADVHPILESGCSSFFCHSGGLANDDIGKAYDTIINKGLCFTILDQVQSGAMPSGKGCSGDPVADAGIPGCLNQEEHDILASWITGDEPCPE